MNFDLGGLCGIVLWWHQRQRWYFLSISINKVLRAHLLRHQGYLKAWNLRIVPILLTSSHRCWVRALSLG
jgi:hypothetical protein